MYNISMELYKSIYILVSTILKSAATGLDDDPKLVKDANLVGLLSLMMDLADRIASYENPQDEEDTTIEIIKIPERTKA